MDGNGAEAVEAAAAAEGRPPWLRNDDAAAALAARDAHHHLWPVVVFLADVLEELRLRVPPLRVAGGPRRRVRARIVDRDLVLHRREVETGDAFDGAELRRVWHGP